MESTFKVIPEFTNYEINKDGCVRHIMSGTVLKSNRSDYVSYLMLCDTTGLLRQQVPNLFVAKLFPNSFGGKEIEKFFNYRVFDDGRIYSLKTGLFMTPQPRERNKSNKYDMTVRLSRIGESGKRISHNKLIHRLVAEAYLPNPNKLPEVNHKDGNPSNNNVDNLEWVSKVDNAKHASENYLFTGSQHHVIAYRELDDEPLEFISMQQAADELSMKSKNANKNISECCIKNASDKLNRGISNKVKPFRTEGWIFKYKD